MQGLWKPARSNQHAFQAAMSWQLCACTHVRAFECGGGVCRRIGPTESAAAVRRGSTSARAHFCTLASLQAHQHVVSDAIGDILGAFSCLSRGRAVGRCSQKAPACMHCPACTRDSLRSRCTFLDSFLDTCNSRAALRVYGPCIAGVQASSPLSAKGPRP